MGRLLWGGISRRKVDAKAIKRNSKIYIHNLQGQRTRKMTMTRLFLFHVKVTSQVSNIYIAISEYFPQDGPDYYR